MEIWIPITITAAFLQNLRSALQKHLQGTLGTRGASFVRFGYGLPVAILYVLGLHYLGGFSFPALGWTFAFWVVAGGLAQIFGTMLLVHLFTLRNFAVGTAYSKTEPVQAALFGLVILGETVSWAGLVALMVGVTGVMLISTARAPLSWKNLGSAMMSHTALLGIASGSLFAIASVATRSAALSLEGTGPFMQAAISLACVTTFQTIFMLLWMWRQDRNEIVQVIKTWRTSGLVGLASVFGSIGWYTAMAIQQVAYVRALAQIELVFTFMASWFLFKERINAVEAAGCLLIIGGILGFLLS